MDELVISDRRYISTRRAGKEHGYHSDYIGQLIRGGKVQGQKVGRSWYVDAESLAAYLGKEYSTSVGPAAAATEVAKVIEPEVAEVAVAEPEVVEAEVELPAQTPAEILPPVEEVVAEVNKQPLVNEFPAQKEEEQQILIRKPAAVSQTSIQKSASAEPVVVPITRVMPRIDKEETEPRTYGLRYMPDDEPLLPEIQPSANVSRHADTSPVISKQGSVRPAKTFRPIAGVALAAGVGIAAVALGAAASALVSSTVSVVDGQTASVFYSFGQ